MKKWNNRYSRKDFIQICWADVPWIDVIDFKELKRHLDQRRDTFFEHLMIPGPNSKKREKVFCRVSRENGRVKLDYTTAEVKEHNKDADLDIGLLILNFNNHNMTFITRIEWISENESENPYNEKIECNWYYEGVFENPQDVSTELNQTTNETQKESIVQSRLKQGKFREGLIECFNGKCPISGIDNLGLLVASHIIPWAQSNNRQRLDPNNGLLLAVHLDKLFDRGYISFDDDGSMILSEDLSSELVSYYHLAEKLRLDEKYLKSRAENIKYHREKILRR